MTDIAHTPNLDHPMPDLIPDITPCPCNSDCSTICVTGDEGWHWVTCLGCFRESITKAASIESAVAQWNDEIEIETRNRLE